MRSQKISTKSLYNRDLQANIWPKSSSESTVFWVFDLLSVQPLISVVSVRPIRLRMANVHVEANTRIEP